jgi:hypothetical protein
VILLTAFSHFIHRSARKIDTERKLHGRGLAERKVAPGTADQSDALT